MRSLRRLKKMVQQLGEKVQKLEQAHDQDQKTHEQDQQQIQRLGAVGRDAEDGDRRAAEGGSRGASATVQADAGEGNATHNFTMVGDAEIQFGKVDGQHSGFVLADFAPIFLFRARDNVLFEAGFDIKLQNELRPATTSGTGGGATTTFDLSFAQLDYLFNDYVTLVAGTCCCRWARMPSGARGGSIRFRTIRCPGACCRAAVLGPSCGARSRWAAGSVGDLFCLPGVTDRARWTGAGTP